MDCSTTKTKVDIAIMVEQHKRYKQFYMKHVSIIILIVIFSNFRTYSQNDKDRHFCIEANYQISSDKLVGFGIGNKKALDFSIKTMNKKYPHQCDLYNSLSYFRFINNDSLSDYNVIKTEVNFVFKFFFIGIDQRVYFQKRFLRWDFEPAIGIGYKYLWFSYSRNLKIINDGNISFAKNNLTFKLIIPIIKY